MRKFIILFSLLFLISGLVIAQDKAVDITEIGIGTIIQDGTAPELYYKFGVDVPVFGKDNSDTLGLPKTFIVSISGGLQHTQFNSI